MSANLQFFSRNYFDRKNEIYLMKNIMIPQPTVKIFYTG